MMNCLFEIGLNNAIAVTFLAVLVFFITRLWRNEHVAHALWILVLIKFVFPPIFQTPIGLSGQLLGGSSVVAKPTESLALNRSEMEVDQNGRGIQSARDATSRQDDTDSRATNASATQPVISSGEFQIPSAKSVIFAFWLVGSAVCLLRMVVQTGRFGRLVRAAVPAPAEIHALATARAEALGLRRCPDVRLIDADVSPGIWSAWRRPVVLLPTMLVQSLSPGELSAILGHEIAHIRRRDHWVRSVEVLVVSLYWWHPVAWWTRRELRQTEEICCDGRVLATNCGSRETYSQALLATVELVAGSCRTTPELALPFSQNRFLKRRLEMILENKYAAAFTSRYWLAFAVLAFGVLPLSTIVADAAGDGNDVAPSETTKIPQPAKSAGEIGSGESPVSSDDEPEHLPPNLTVVETRLADFVRSFNEKNSEGITVSEIVSAIKNWDREKQKVDDKTHKVFQQISKSGMLPPRAGLNSWEQWRHLHKDDKEEVQIRRIDLDVMTGKNKGYTFVVRRQVVGRRLHLPTGSGFTWALNPHHLCFESRHGFQTNSGEFVSDDYYVATRTDSSGALLVFAGLSKKKYGGRDSRFVAFDENANRCVLSHWGGPIFGEVLLATYRLDPTKLPASKVKYRSTLDLRPSPNPSNLPECHSAGSV